MSLPRRCRPPRRWTSSHLRRRSHVTTQIIVAAWTSPRPPLRLLFLHTKASRNPHLCIALAPAGRPAAGPRRQGSSGSPGPPTCSDVSTFCPPLLPCLRRRRPRPCARLSCPPCCSSPERSHLLCARAPRRGLVPWLRSALPAGARPRSPTPASPSAAARTTAASPRSGHGHAVATGLPCSRTLPGLPAPGRAPVRVVRCARNH